MAIKYREAEKLRLETRKKLTATPENWMQFLKTASNTYKYSYSDQLMIAAQFPNATAVASFDVWSDRFGRKIKSGEKGIGLIDDSGTYPKMKYVFDISQSVRYRDVPQPYVWDLQEEYKDELILSLAGDLSISIEEAVSDFCENTVDSLLSDYQNAVLSEAKGSDVLYGLDDTAISSEFRQAVFESVKYMALIRCGLPTDTVDIDVFRNLSDFSDLTITDILGTAISNISEQVLREIEATVKTVERRNQNEHIIEEQRNRRSEVSAERGEYDILSNNEAGQTDRFDIYSRRKNIHIHSQSDSTVGRSDNRTMGTETEEVSERTQGMDLSENVGRRNSDGSPDSDRQGGRGNDGNADTGVDEERGRNGSTESSRSDGVGTPTELDREQSGGSSPEQADLRLTEKPKQKRQRRKTTKAEETVSPAFSPFPVGEQMSLFASERSEQDRANEYAMSKIISHGTAFEDGKFRIAEYFSGQHTKAEKAKFLSDEYGWGGYAGGGESMDYRPNKGITMSYTDKDNPENNITVHLTYPQLADMIDFLIANDMYITPKDIEDRQQRAIYYLKNYDPNNPLEAPQIEKAKAILDSYNIDYSQLLASQPEVETVTPEQVEEMNASIPDDVEIPDMNAPAVPIEQEETVYSESAIVAEFRNKTTESFHLIGDKTEFDIELEVEELLRQEMIDNEIAGDIEAVVLYGSRSRGLETSEDTDIDIVVQINNAELKEDALFNLFSDMDIEIDGIPVDVNPIRPEETGTLEDYLPKAEAYLEQKQAERAAQIFSSSVGEQEEDDPYLITDPVITIDKYNFTVDFNDTAYIRSVSEGSEYLGGIDSDGHERKDNFRPYKSVAYVTFEDDHFYRHDDAKEYIDSSFPITKEEAANVIEEIIDKALSDEETELNITSHSGITTVLDKDSFSVVDEAQVGLEVPDEQEALIEEAKKRISDFVAAEYDGDSANFSDLSNIGIAYTTTEDGEHEIQASVDLINTSIVKRVDGGVISLTKYETLADLVDALNDLDFADLTYISDEQLQQINERENSDDDLKITSMAVNVEPQVIEDSISVEIGLSESPIIDDLNERIANSTEPLTFAAVNAAFEYLDQKQHLERLDPLLKAGWYKKTDFTIKAVIDGEEFNYGGRFDIGDGKGTGGGSLIDHISDFINYTLAPTNPYHLSDDELAEQQKVKDIVIPFLREHEEL